MAKKHKKADISKTEQPQNIQFISPAGKKIILGGGGLLVAGFFVLTRTDSHGRNWASHLVPFLLLAGYALIAFGILYRGKEGANPPSSPPPLIPPGKTT